MNFKSCSKFHLGDSALLRNLLFVTLTRVLSLKSIILFIAVSLSEQFYLSVLHRILSPRHGASKTGLFMFDQLLINYVQLLENAVCFLRFEFNYLGVFRSQFKSHQNLLRLILLEAVLGQKR